MQKNQTELNSTKEAEPLLSVSDLVRIFRVGRKTIYSAVDRGLIPHIRLWGDKHRGLIRFRKKDVQGFIEELLRQEGGH